MPGEYKMMVGVGGIGSGTFFLLRGRHTLGRNESRAATILRRHDFCKLHIIAHYVAVLLGAGRGGMAVLPIGKVGDDPAGAAMIEHMRRAGMDARFVSVESGSSTLFSVCLLYEDGDGGNITNDDSASWRLSPADVEGAMAKILAGAPNGAGSCGIALAAPEVPLASRKRLLELSPAGWFRAVAVTTAEVKQASGMGLFGLADLVSLNLEEAGALVDAKAGDAPETIVQAAGGQLANAQRDIRLCVTAGAEGVYGWRGGRMEHTPACPAPVVGTAGAGDAVLSALIVAEAVGLPFILPDRPARKNLAHAPLATGLDLAALLAGLAVSCADTINFRADARALADLVRRIGADASQLGPVLGEG